MAFLFVLIELKIRTHTIRIIMKKEEGIIPIIEFLTKK